MAVRQYVGARYVPKFADPVAWQSGTSYEALTIVTYNNSSYTSKIPVPATVGNPADNDTYWALTGNYNAQVEDYRQTTLQVQENLNEEIQNREEAINSLEYLKKAKYIDVTTVGIKNDGSESINNTINSLFEAYDLLYFPIGTYLITSPIDVPANKYIIGNNANITASIGHNYSGTIPHEFAPPLASTCFRLHGNNYISGFNFTIIGSAISITGSHNIVKQIQSNIQSPTDNSNMLFQINVYDTNYDYIENVYITKTGLPVNGDGIHIFSNVNYLTISHCYLDGSDDGIGINPREGLTNANSTFITVNDSYIGGLGLRIYCDETRQANNITISNCSITSYNNTVPPMHCGGRDLTIGSKTDVVGHINALIVDNCKIGTAGDYGVYFAQVLGNTITFTNTTCDRFEFADGEIDYFEFNNVAGYIMNFDADFSYAPFIASNLRINIINDNSPQPTGTFNGRCNPILTGCDIGILNTVGDKTFSLVNSENTTFTIAEINEGSYWLNFISGLGLQFADSTIHGTVCIEQCNNAVLGGKTFNRFKGMYKIDSAPSAPQSGDYYILNNALVIV